MQAKVSGLVTLSVCNILNKHRSERAGVRYLLDRQRALFPCPAPDLLSAGVTRILGFKTNINGFRPDSKDGVHRFFYMDVKTAVDSGSLNLGVFRHL